MKKFILAITATISMLHSEAKVWRVNNTTGIVADFNNLQNAVNAAASGDTILVEGSAADYGSPALNKKLVLIGTGYFLTDVMPNPPLQANKNPSTLGNVYFNAGSKGSVLQGFAMAGVTIDDSLITIQRNKMAGAINIAQNRDVHGDTIRNNYMQSYIQNAANNKKCTDLLIYNNIFTYNYALAFNSSNINNASGYFINNSVVAGSCRIDCIGFVFQNNILPNVDFFTYQSSNTFFNNIAGNTGIPTGNGNQQNVNMNNVYVGLNDGTGFSSDGRYQTKATSPSLGAGVLNGSAVDCGAFGGPAPYILSGMPPVPSVYELSAPAQVVFGAASINVSISAAAH